MPRTRDLCITAALLSLGVSAGTGCRSKASPVPSGTQTAEMSPVKTPGQLTYTPEGCSYTVSTPDVDDADLSEIGPGTAVPDHIHASFAGDPSTTFAVNWRTVPAQKASFLLLGTNREQVAAAQSATDGVQLRKAHTLLYRGTLDLEKTRLHEAHVCGLQPNTTYFYKVGATGAFSAVYPLRTGPGNDLKAPFRFGIAGDARDNVTTFASVQKGLREAGVAFQIFTGDAVMAGARQSHWNALFEAGSPGATVQETLASVPFMVANGNHESLSLNYLAQFALPQSASRKDTVHGEEWYAFDYGGAHFIALNDTTTDELSLQQETVWLEDHLKHIDRAKTPWVIAYHHRPLYSCGSKHGSDVKLRQRWQPLFDQYKVDIVFNGHDHQYERSKLIRGLETDGAGRVVTAAANDQIHAGDGTIYVVAAGAGAGLYPLKEDCPHAAVKEQTFHYLVADVAEKTLTVKVYRLDGSLLDAFTITR